MSKIETSKSIKQQKRMRARVWTWLIFTVAVLTAVGSVALTGPASAQNKDDFETASRESGCGLIPYYGLRRDCRTYYDNQRDWCTGSRKEGCKDLSKSEKDKEEAKERRANAIQCLQLRGKVKETYEEALRRLANERGEDIKPLVDQIVQKINAERPGHDRALEETQNRIESCNKILD